MGKEEQVNSAVSLNLNPDDIDFQEEFDSSEDSRADLELIEEEIKEEKQIQLLRILKWSLIVLFAIIVVTTAVSVTVIVVQKNKKRQDFIKQYTAENPELSSAGLKNQVAVQKADPWDFDYEDPSKRDGFDLSVHVVFPKGANPYEILEAPPFNNRVEENQEVHNVDHLTIIPNDIMGKEVLNLVMHRDYDGDGNMGSDLPYRQRTEFKASSASDDEVLGYEDDTLVYMWWFRLNEDITPTYNFFHVFQLKVYGDVAGMPMFTFSIEKVGQDNRFLYGDFGHEFEIGKLSQFAGKWIQARVEVQYSEKGYTEFDLKDINGNSMMFKNNYKPFRQSNVNRWISGSELVRPKWGIYRYTERIDEFNKIDDASYTDFKIYKKKFKA